MPDVSIAGFIKIPVQLGTVKFVTAARAQIVVLTLAMHPDYQSG